MPHVRKSQLLGVVRELWGSTGVIEDEAKLVLAEQLINDVWENKKSGIPMNMAGVPIKAALGDRWLSSHERSSAGKPNLRQVLSDDPYFVLKETGGVHPNVRLRISRLSQLIDHPELIEEYRWTPSTARQQQATGASSSAAAAAGSSSAVGAAAGGSSSTAAAGSSGGSSKVMSALNSEGLPLRPGEPDCVHWMKHGWCLFKDGCWYNHPEARGRVRRSPTPGGGANLTESHVEPGVMLRDGLYPIRPGQKACAFYLKNGYCMYKAKCRNHHPSLQEGAQDSIAAAPGPSTATASAADDASGGGAPVVKQPPVQQLLGVVVDAVWPPQESSAVAAKGALAKIMLEGQLQPGDVADETKKYELLMAQAGLALSKWWSNQQQYDPGTKPYKSLADLLAGDPCFTVSVNSKGAGVVNLLLHELLELGGPKAAASLSSMSDVVWPPLGGQEVWLRGRLAKWLITAGFEGDNGRVLRQVLAVGADAPTVFRIDMAQAGEYLRRCWEAADHPYDASSSPWSKFITLIGGDRFLYIEPAPGKANSQHVTLDLADMLNHYPAIARYTRPPTRVVTHGTAGASSSSSAAAAGLSVGSGGGGGGASSNSRAAAADDALDLEDDSDELLEVLTTGSCGGGSSAPAAAATPPPLAAAAAAPRPAAAAAAGAAGGASGGRGSSSASAADIIAEAEADLAAIAELRYDPPEQMQWWWPDNKPDNPNFVWAEIAIRLVDPFAEDAELQVAEMVQHLEISPVLALACATYKSQPHLLQFFAPYAAIGGLEMPAAVYLIDIMKPGRQVQQVLELIKPVLSSPANLKVCHGSKLWSGQLMKAFHIELHNYFDTQQANYVWQCLRFEAGRSAHSTKAALMKTAEVSLSAMLRTFDYYHPERHAEKGKDGVRVWQDRPFSEDLITCAAADVAYLVPLMEVQVRNLKLVAGEVRTMQQHSRPGTRAASLLSSLPPELTEPTILATLAQGAETKGAGLNTNKVQEWGQLAVFHQAPLHDSNLALNQSYGAIRGGVSLPAGRMGRQVAGR